MPEALDWRWGWKRFAQSVGLAALLLAVNYGDLLGGGSDVRMHVPYRLVGICLAQIADIFLLGAILFGIAAAFHRTRFYCRVRVFYMLFIPAWLILRTQMLFPFEVREGLAKLLALAWIALLLVVLLRFPLWYPRMVRAADGLGIVLAIFAVCSIAQLAYVTTWRPAPNEITPAWAGKANPPRTHARIVWVLFDELSYDQVFEHRAQDLALPNFDRLRAESTLYTDVQPIGMRTVKIIPSLLSGHTVTDYRYSFGNKLSVQDHGESGFHALQGSGTVFGDAHRDGWRTGVVGWYNPYCSLYARALDSCYWTDLDRMDGNMAQKQSWGRNVARPLRDMAMEIGEPAVADRQGCDFDVELRLKTYRDLQAHAEKLLADDQADFVYLHLPVPHSPNIWSRKDGEFTHTCGSSYLDNLALADRELGRVMSLVQSSPRWKDTTVIVEGDHSWRVMLWDWLAAWTAEDERASREGEFDPRPALLIHDAGQTHAATDGRALRLIVVHRALENAIAGKPASIQ